MLFSFSLFFFPLHFSLSLSISLSLFLFFFFYSHSHSLSLSSPCLSHTSTHTSTKRFGSLHGRRARSCNPVRAYIPVLYHRAMLLSESVLLLSCGEETRRGLHERRDNAPPDCLRCGCCHDALRIHLWDDSDWVSAPCLDTEGKKAEEGRRKV